MSQPTTPLPICALIVDDEELSRKNLFLALKTYPNWEVVAQVKNVHGARTLLNDVQVDVIFLDIRMPKESGLDFARELSHPSNSSNLSKASNKNNMPLIIFVTAFNQHAIEAFQLHALDYLLKPVEDQRLQQAIERAQQMLTLRQQANYAQALRSYVHSEEQQQLAKQEYWQHVCIRSIGKIETIQLADVAWIEAQGNYMQLHLAERKVMYRASMVQLEKYLDATQFIRTHRSTIVAKNQIASIQVMADGTYKMTLSCGDEVMISERYLSDVKEWMQ